MNGFQVGRDFLKGKKRVGETVRWGSRHACRLSHPLLLSKPFFLLPKLLGLKVGKTLRSVSSYLKILKLFGPSL